MRKSGVDLAALAARGGLHADQLRSPKSRTCWASADPNSFFRSFTNFGKVPLRILGKRLLFVGGPIAEANRQALPQHAASTAPSPQLTHSPATQIRCHRTTRWSQYLLVTLLTRLVSAERSQCLSIHSSASYRSSVLPVKSYLSSNAALNSRLERSSPLAASRRSVSSHDKSGDPTFDCSVCSVPLADLPCSGLQATTARMQANRAIAKLVDRRFTEAAMLRMA